MPVLLTLLLWSLVEVHSQSFPRLSFNGTTTMSKTLANHSYVDLSEVGTTPQSGAGSGVGDSVQCHSDLTTCCTNTNGPHRGDWYFPDGTLSRWPHTR